MIRALLVAALLATPVPALAQVDGQWVCSAGAKGSKDSHVDVGMHIDANGEVLTRYVSWQPPRIETSKSQYPDLGAPGLTIYYDDAEADAIGELTNAVGDVSSVGGPDRAFRRVTLHVLLDGGDSWTADLERFAPEYKIGANRYRYASADLTRSDWDGDPYERLETGPTAMLSLRDTMGRPVAQARFDLAAKAERDRLFRTAWRRAEAMAKNPKKCDKAGDGEEEPLP
ncbi:MAG: hypothetical protein JNL35_13190 [Sphingopyxis sp.]|nr:hypothetical protein [Sphingopyxis sp.]